MIEYVRHRISKIDNSQPIEEQKKVLEDIGKELMERGYTHFEVYALINRAVSQNLTDLKIKLNAQCEKLKKLLEKFNEGLA
jgi:hypothetical protein